MNCKRDKMPEVQKKPCKITAGSGHTAKKNQEDQGEWVPRYPVACSVMLHLCTVAITPHHFRNLACNSTQANLCHRNTCCSRTFWYRAFPIVRCETTEEWLAYYILSTPNFAYASATAMPSLHFNPHKYTLRHP